MLYRQVIRPVLFRSAGSDPEIVHQRVLEGLVRVSQSPMLRHALALAASLGGTISPGAGRQVFGLHFPNLIGLAAGFDKNARAVPALAALGFGFIEVGTVTREAQPGNPSPRLFRLPQDEALINRMGFNNEGAKAVALHLAQMRPAGVPIGISLGKSKATPLEDATDDYVASLDVLYPFGNYFAVNISSPNTPGLRALQEGDRLDALLAALMSRLSLLAELESPARATPKPLLVKVSPDLEHEALDEVVDVCLARGVSGLIAVNTTISRDGLSKSSTTVGKEVGGLSGGPLRQRALSVVRYLHARCGDRLSIIGCGGISNASDAWRMLDAGAVLVQLYTSFIYEGPLVARRLARQLERQKGS